MNKFYKDLEFGKIYERKALEYFDYDDFTTNDDYRFDIKFIKDKTETKVEVKADTLTYKTGNLAIEYKYKDRDSGINKTHADYYLYFVVNPDNPKQPEVYKIPIEDLRMACKGKKSVSGGDNYCCKMYLIPKNTMSKYLISQVMCKEPVCLL